MQLAASTPRITPEDEAVFKSGNNFQLVCEANKPVEWKLPTISVKFKRYEINVPTCICLNSLFLFSTETLQHSARFEREGKNYKR